MKLVENSSVELRVHEVASMACLLGVALPAKASDAEVLGLLGDALKAMARRDWDVRVLDAWADAFGYRAVGMIRNSSGGWAVELYEGADGQESSNVIGHAESADSARHAAALAVFPTLDRNSPNWPGECP